MGKYVSNLVGFAALVILGFVALFAGTSGDWGGAILLLLIGTGGVVFVTLYKRAQRPPMPRRRADETAEAAEVVEVPGRRLEKVNRLLAAYQERWIEQQLRKSDFPRSYWEDVAREAMALRRDALLHHALDHNPNVPQGWYDIHFTGNLLGVNNNAMRLEKGGELDQALFWYEVVVAEAFGGFASL
jgi:hypothetical protein